MSHTIYGSVLWHGSTDCIHHTQEVPDRSTQAGLQGQNDEVAPFEFGHWNCDGMCTHWMKWIIQITTQVTNQRCSWRYLCQMYFLMVAMLCTISYSTGSCFNRRWMWWEKPKYINKEYAHGLCLFVFCCGLVLVDFSKSIRVTSLALGQSYDCPSNHTIAPVPVK